MSLQAEQICNTFIYALLLGSYPAQLQIRTQGFDG